MAGLLDGCYMLVAAGVFYLWYGTVGYCYLIGFSISYGIYRTLLNAFCYLLRAGCNVIVMLICLRMETRWHSVFGSYGLLWVIDCLLSEVLQFVGFVRSFRYL